MKMKKLPILLLLSLGMFFAPVATSFVSDANNTYVAVRADAQSKADFLAKFKEIRTLQRSEGRSVCETTRDEYEQLLSFYYLLTNEEKTEINAMLDPTNVEGESYTIGEVMKEIVRLFYSPQSISEAPKPKLDQKTTIIIASVVSIVGMSAISVLFILRNNKFIE